MTAVTSYEQYAEALAAGEKMIGQRARAARELDEGFKAVEARLATPGTLRKMAVWYSRQGIPVFPLQPGDKRPLEKSHGFKDATTDDEMVAAIWAVDEFNIGTPTGLSFDVVDVDGPAGVEALMYGQRDWRNGLIGHALTPRPHGHHLFYKASGQGNAAGILPGVDVRGVGGYVVLAPSISHEHGRRYKWIKPLEISA